MILFPKQRVSQIWRRVTILPLAPVTGETDEDAEVATDDAADAPTDADEITATDETVSDGLLEEETTTQDVDDEESDLTENAITHLRSAHF
ncbi:hypothetical protein [Laspinema olomoucense]|nr:hypothetical protein [Laspinema sp. D3c]MCT7973693.1 hypothetical protein [Laspinema sp. D3d]